MVIKLNKKITALALAVIVIVMGITVFLLRSKDSAVFTYTGQKSIDDYIGDDEICVPILMYHEVKPAKSGKDAITPAELESDLKYLKAKNYTAINMTDLISYVTAGTPLPEKPIIISFDDGYYNNYVYTFPLIQKYNTKIVLSIIGKSTDDFTCDPAKNLDYTHLSWAQINEMIDSGLVEIQNHSYNMHQCTKARYGCARNRGESALHYEEALSTDLMKLQNEILLFTGTVPNTFTYPYGKVSEDSVPIIKKLGFKASLSCDYGVNIVTRDTSCLYGLKRICRVHGVSAQKSILGGMQTLKYAKK